MLYPEPIDYKRLVKYYVGVLKVHEMEEEQKLENLIREWASSYKIQKDAPYLNKYYALRKKLFEKNIALLQELIDEYGEIELDL